MEKEVVVDHLTKKFGSLAAVNDISFDVDNGDFFLIIGPSGCGKTTTLRCLMGLETPTSGTIYMGGKDVTNLPTHKRDISLVFQNFALFPHKTVAENIAFGLRMRGYTPDKIKSEVEEIMRITRLEGLGNRYPKELSMGQQQRVALARSLVVEPGVLLMDEPLGNLDYRLQQRMEVELKLIHEKVGLTFVYVTHNQEQAMALAKRIMIMNHGIIEQIGSPDDVYKKPASIFVAKFVGEINMLRGEVEAVKDDIAKVRTAIGTLEAELKGMKFKEKHLAYAVRPEIITIGPRAKEHVNRVEAKYLGQIYKGSDVMYMAQLPTGEVFKIVKQGEDMVDLSGAEKIQLGWDPQDAILIEKPSAVPGIDIDRILLGA
ncbi:MAG: ABC transporter ATP-binding protein [Candidatus Bathyarchaeia archaeon]